MLQYSFIGILAYLYTHNHSYGNIAVYEYIGIWVELGCMSTLVYCYINTLVYSNIYIRMFLH